MSYTEWISRMALALSHNDDYLVMADLYRLSRELQEEEVEDVNHWAG